MKEVDLFEESANLHRFNDSNYLRIFKVSYLVFIFDKYTRLKLNESVLKDNQKMSYESKEMFSALLGVDITKYDRSENEIVNECIKLQQEIETSIKDSNVVYSLGFDRDNIFAFLNHNEYLNGRNDLKRHHLMLNSLCLLYLSYGNFTIQKSYLLDRLKFYQTLDFPIWPLSTKKFITIMQEVENNFNSIIEKRRERENNKIF